MRRPTRAKALSATRIILSGKWRITDMSLWDREAIDLLGPAFIEFRGNRGQFRFIAVDGWIDCRHGRQNGRPSVDFTWDGNDEGDPASGRGSVLLRQDGSLTGHIYFHRGDDSSFTALPFEDDERLTARSSPKGKQHLREGATVPGGGRRSAGSRASCAGTFRVPNRSRRETRTEIRCRDDEGSR